MKSIGKVILTSAIVALYLAGSSCSTTDPDNDPNLIARVGKQRLMREELNKALTKGLASQDSTRLARTYIRAWIDSHIMGEVAGRNIPDMSEIDRMVDEYRNELIAWEYRRLMFIQHGDKDYPTDSIVSYYEKHAADFVLERPLVKGVYIKIADNSPSLSRVKKLYKSTRDADIDRLEKQDLQGVIHFDYFRDRWVDWEQIETRVPIDFGSSPDAFLATNKNVEVSVNGYTHLLEITEFLKTGASMPLERAEERIRRDLFNQHRREYDTRLRMDLFNQGISDGTIVINTPLD